VMLSQAERRQEQVELCPSATVVVLKRWNQCDCSGVVPPNILCPCIHLSGILFDLP
jgi:hypothetical protein